LSTLIIGHKNQTQTETRSENFKPNHVNCLTLKCAEKDSGETGSKQKAKIEFQE